MKTGASSLAPPLCTVTVHEWEKHLMSELYLAAPPPGQHDPWLPDGEVPAARCEFRWPVPQTSEDAEEQVLRPASSSNKSYWSHRGYASKARSIGCPLKTANEIEVELCSACASELMFRCEAFSCDLWYIT